MVARPGIRYTMASPKEKEAYALRAPTPIIAQPLRHIREGATQYLHYGVARVLDMCPAVPRKAWLSYERAWLEKGVPWLRSQGHDPDELIARMIYAAKGAIAA
jgi:hypothetical protein